MIFSRKSSAGSAHHAVRAASCTALGIPAIDKSFRPVFSSHYRDLTVGKSFSVAIEPGPVFCIGEPVDIILKALLKFRQVKVQIRTVVTVGIRMSVFIIFNGQVDRIVGIAVIVQVKTNLCFIDRQFFCIDVVHILRRKVLCQLFLETGIKTVVRVQIIFKGKRHIRFGKGCDGAVCHASPESVRQFRFFTVDRDCCAVASVRILIDAYSAL